MPRAILSAVIAVVTVLAGSPLPSDAAPLAPVRVIVVLRAGAADPGAIASELGRRNGFAPSLVYRHAIRGFAASVPAGRLAALGRDPRVAYVERDQVASIAAQSTPTGLLRIDATTNTEIAIDGLDDVRVDADFAIVDSGIDATHPDLNVVSGVDCTGGGPTGTGACVAGQTDGNGHGTHVAGTVGALDNGIGVVGVAPGVRLWAVRVLGNNGSGYFSWILAGIDYVYANRATIDVVNMSLGCECSDGATRDAILATIAAGVVVVVAAGNSDKNVSGFFPANVNGVIRVSALADFDGRPNGDGAPTCRTDQDDTLADFSNWGSSISIAAPGVCITSTWKGGGYKTISGTSMASPHVAGAAALLKSDNPSMTPAQVLADLQSAGTTDWEDDSGDNTKEKLLNVAGARVATVSTGGASGTPPTWVAVSAITGTAQTQRNGWTARFTTTVRDSNGALVAGATVSGTITPAGGAAASVSCLTGSTGTCTASLSKISTSVASAAFAVTTVTGGPAGYDAGQSTLTTLTVTR